MATFIEPSTLEEALTRREDLVRKLRDIDVQLSSRNRTAPDGRRMSSDEYWDWHNRAVSAKRHYEAEMSRLKSWVKTRRSSEQLNLAKNLQITDPTDPGQLLTAAREIFWRLERDDVEMTEEERAVRNLINDYLTLRRGA